MDGVMEDLQRVCTLLTDAKKTSNDIIRKSLVSMRKLREGGDEILEEIRKLKPDVPISQIKELAEKASLEMIRDAETVLREIDGFAGALAHNKNVEESGSEFMLQVWNGDTYDEVYINGLEELVKDLKQQYRKCGSSRIIELASA